MSSVAPDAESLSGERFGFTLFVSICVHAVLILGVGFSIFEDMNKKTSIDITLAQYRSNTSPVDADFLAQANQLGSGSLDEKASPSTPVQSQFNDDQIQDVSPFAEQQIQQPDSQQPILASDSTEPDQLASQQDAEPNQANDNNQLLENLSSTEISKTLASLQAQLDLHRQEYAKRPRKHTISSASTKQARDALYLETWRKKIESIGNLNYPQQASQEGIYGKLRLLVALRPDGSVNQIKVLSSSGSSILDNAAIHIVQLGSPFEPFSEEMRQDIDILEIIRTWQFHNNNSFSSY